MTMLEAKVDALVRIALAADSADKSVALSELRSLMEGRIEAPMEEEIRAFLSEFDIPDGSKGYNQLVMALELAIEEPRLLNALHKGLYPRVAELCASSERHIERNIGRCIERSWECGNNKAWERYFANTISLRTGRPSTGAFLIRCVREIRRRLGR